MTDIRYEDTYRYKMYHEMEERFGVDVADRVFSLDEEVSFLRVCSNKPGLVLVLRLVAEMATALADKIETEGGK